MSTSWFGIDKDGNVCVIEFNENGPVPYGCEQQVISGLISDNMASTARGNSKYLNYSLDQALELEKTLKAPSFDRIEFDCVIKIDVKSVERFKELCIRNIKNNRDYSNTCPYVSVCEERGLYIVDFYSWSDRDKQYLLDCNILLGIRDSDIYTDDIFSYEKKKWIFENDLSGYPYFLYQQPYSTDQLTERTYIPTIPFKEEQLSIENRRNALHFPFSFAETQFVQVAEFFQCESNAEEKIEYDGIRTISHNVYPVPEGGSICVRNCNIGNPICELCYKCMLPGYDAYEDFSMTQYGLYPTVVQIISPADIAARKDYPPIYKKLFEDRINLLKVISIPIIAGIPKKSDQGYLYGEKLQEEINRQDLNKWFENCRQNFEKNIASLLPRAILATKETSKILGNYYRMEKFSIEICDASYPYYVMGEDDKFIAELIKLSKLPYRGIMPRRITPYKV